MSGMTDYGFKWGPLEVMRLFEHRGRRVLRVSTDHHKVEIYVSPGGRSVRVYIDGREAS